MKIDASELARQLDALRFSKGDTLEVLDPAAESQHIYDLVQNHLVERLQEYAEAEAVGYGASSIVIKAVCLDTMNHHALKFPRKHVVYPPLDAPELPVVNHEREALAKISHRYITRLFDAVPLSGLRKGAELLITTFIPNPSNLSDYVQQYLCAEQCTKDDALFERRLGDLASHIYHIAEALQYLHEEVKLLHFDIKPDNILISADNEPYLTDFDLAQSKEPAEGRDRIEVGFTFKYAHPSLQAGIQHRTRSGGQRVRSGIPSKEFTAQIDLYAFGRTLQEVLWIITHEHGQRCHSQYWYNYLHVVAALCLDGRNVPGQPAPQAPKGTFASDIPLDIPESVFRAQHFDSFREVAQALERLLGHRRLESELPEIDPHTSSTINVTELGPTPLTGRVVAVLNHPVFRRLHLEQQLGMIEAVYPTASHTRLEHSLGVYHMAREYLSHLYYDPENPTFRVLFTPDKGRLVLLAALLHDVGQTAFGHDVEEVDSLGDGSSSRGQTYDHVHLGLRLLGSPMYLDDCGRTLSQVIEVPEEQGGWEIMCNDLATFLHGRGLKPFDQVLHEIIDSPLDADKLDYLTRDSVNCRVRYGQGIDHKRFFSSLTTAPRSTTGQLALAIKRKGAASAEDILLTRYQMHQSVYWHHTFRCSKAMFIEAASLALQDLREGVQGSFEEGDAYFHFVLERSWDNQLWKRRGSAKGSRLELRQRLIDRLGNEADNPKCNSKWAWDRTILYLWRISSPIPNAPSDFPWGDDSEESQQDLVRIWRQGKARQLLIDLLERRYYKRVLEVPVLEYDEASHAVLASIATAKRSELSWKVTNALLNLANRNIQSKSRVRLSTHLDRENLGNSMSSRVPVLVDVPPSRTWQVGTGRYEIHYVDDYKRRYFRALGEGTGVTRAHWDNILPQMMKGIAYLRVFCEPDLHWVLTRNLDNLRETVSTIENALGLRRKPL